MADAENEDYKTLMLERADEAVVADAVSPELTKSALETLQIFRGSSSLPSRS